MNERHKDLKRIESTKFIEKYHENKYEAPHKYVANPHDRHPYSVTTRAFRSSVSDYDIERLERGELPRSARRRSVEHRKSPRTR